MGEIDCSHGHHDGVIALSLAIVALDESQLETFIKLLSNI